MVYSDFNVKLELQAEQEWHHAIVRSISIPLMSPICHKQPFLFFSCLFIASCYVNVTRFCAILAKSNIGDCFRADCEEKLLLSKQFLFLLLNFLFQVLLSVQPWKFHDKTLYKVLDYKKVELMHFHTYCQLSKDKDLHTLFRCVCISTCCLVTQ